MKKREVRVKNKFSQKNKCSGGRLQQHYPLKGYFNVLERIQPKKSKIKLSNQIIEMIQLAVMIIQTVTRVRVYLNLEDDKRINNSSKVRL